MNPFESQPFLTGKNSSSQYLSMDGSEKAGNKSSNSLHIRLPGYPIPLHKHNPTREQRNLGFGYTHNSYGQRYGKSLTAESINGEIYGLLDDLSDSEKSSRSYLSDNSGFEEDDEISIYSGLKPATAGDDKSVDMASKHSITPSPHLKKRGSLGNGSSKKKKLLIKKVVFFFFFFMTRLKMICRFVMVLFMDLLEEKLMEKIMNRIKIHKTDERRRFSEQKRRLKIVAMRVL
jgi:hypothetical protein